MNIADRLKNLRKEAGLSQEQLAEMLDISRQAVSKWESAQGNPDIENVIKLSEIYNVSTDYILLGKEKYAEQEAYAGQERYNGQDKYAEPERYIGQELYAAQEPYGAQHQYAAQHQYTEQKIPPISNQKETAKREMHPETRKIIGIIAIIMAVAMSGALFIAALSLINRFLS